MGTATAGKGSDRTDILVLYEDAEVLVISKPSGMMVHEDGYSEGETLVDWFLTRAPEARGVGEPGRSPQGRELERSGIVHRLDRETSGVMVLAKTQKAHEHLKQQFKSHAVRKAYRAFVYGTMRHEWGTIDRPIGRSAKDFRKRSAERGAKGTLREARSHWERIGQSATHAYLTLRPETGRTHQLRVHLKAIGRPIVMDTRYAPPVTIEQEACLGFERLALHAHTLALTLPNGEPHRFSAPLPADFCAAEERIAEA